MTITLEQVLAHCEPIGECLCWMGRMHNGSPVIKGTDREMRARRIVFAALSKAEIPSGKHPIPTCRDPRCLNFKHLALRTTQQIAQLAAAEGRFASPSRKAACTAAARKSPNAKLTPEMVAEIRVSEESGPVLAERYGVNRSLIPRIKRGDAWASAVSGASVFNL